jgi:hypothetical protein
MPFAVDPKCGIGENTMRNYHFRDRDPYFRDRDRDSAIFYYLLTEDFFTNVLYSALTCVLSTIGWAVFAGFYFLGCWRQMD